MSDDADLLVELATLDEVQAWVPTNADHVSGVTPPWCELVLEIRRTDDESLITAWPINERLPLRRHDGELIIQVINDVLHPDRVSAVDGIWDELDAVVASIQRRVERDREPLRRDVGIAYGLALALAVLANPDDPDVDAVRAEAMQRYEADES